MKTRYRFIYFEQFHSTWFCHNIKSEAPLCSIEYYKPWRQWAVTSVCPGTVFSGDCLTDIANFMGQLEKP